MLSHSLEGRLGYFCSFKQFIDVGFTIHSLQTLWWKEKDSFSYAKMVAK